MTNEPQPQSQAFNPIQSDFSPHHFRFALRERLRADLANSYRPISIILSLVVEMRAVTSRHY